MRPVIGVVIPVPSARPPARTDCYDPGWMNLRDPVT